MTNSISFIGGGNMATAIIGGLLADGTPAASIEVVDVSGDTCARLTRQFGVKACTAPAEAQLAGVIVLAVKPQQLPEVAKQLAPRLRGQLVVSIAAGVRLADLVRWLGGYARIVRAMPNTPAMVGAGISGLFAGEALEEADRSAAESILRAVGAVVWVGDEGELDWVTALSGSGPAYVFHFIEAMEEAGIKGGLSGEVARRLALHTVFGAAKLALEAGEDPAVLRAKVTSRGGTTERALASLDADGFIDMIARAVNAAAARSKELGDELGRLS
ncbi:MAG: pyrroline-5-carboxylate reductase [Pseudomonadota bacterium]